ncbi:recombinase family protein [Sinorhizobium meliloti]|uniref:recombinase family protein n=1 Tax=Rhizobium meliloti TaxID=382 RepID=UPI001F2B231E|nr:recombinase family protein [Sinorhizobium meliloti]
MNFHAGTRDGPRGVKVGPNLGRAAKTAKASEFASHVTPIARELQAGGASLRAIAAVLTSRGIPTPRGGAWSAVQVKRIIERSEGKQTLNAADILNELITRGPSRLDALPHDHGIYALHDHAGNIRYIGITKGDKYGFYGRIYSRHVSGSEGRSHKFSHAYNTGRMWRAKRDSSPDAGLAKHLRTAFVRRHCRASYVIVPPPWGDLSQLEVAVQALAPEGMFAWGSRRAFDPLSEPNELVDAVIDDLHFTSAQRDAVERQAALSLMR